MAVSVKDLDALDAPAGGDEAAFRAWYAGWARKAGIDPNPDAPEHRYDYRAAYRAGVTPTIDPNDGLYHWPSQFKADDHPNRYVGGVDTKNGRPAGVSVADLDALDRAPAGPTPAVKAPAAAVSPPVPRRRFTPITAAERSFDAVPPVVSDEERMARGVTAPPVTPTISANTAPASTPLATAGRAVRDILFPPSVTGTTAHERDIAASSAQASIERQAKEAGVSVPALKESVVGPQAPLERVAKGVQRGMVGTGESLAGAYEWVEHLLGVKTPLGAAAGEAAEAMRQKVEALQPADPGFADKLAEGVGSMATFLIPAIGTEAAIVQVARVAPRLARMLGMSVASVNEALAEAGDSYRSLQEQGIAPDEAARRAGKVFGQNVVLVAATNKLGLFSEGGSTAARTAKTALLEGAQEGGQYDIQRRAAGQPFDAKQFGESAAVGAIVGGGAGLTLGQIDRMGRQEAATPAGASEAPAAAGAPPTEPEAPAAEPARPAPGRRRRARVTDTGNVAPVTEATRIDEQAPAATITPVPTPEPQQEAAPPAAEVEIAPVAPAVAAPVDVAALDRLDERAPAPAPVDPARAGDIGQMLAEAGVNGRVRIGDAVWVKTAEDADGDVWRQEAGHETAKGVEIIDRAIAAKWDVEKLESSHGEVTPLYPPESPRATAPKKAPTITPEDEEQARRNEEATRLEQEAADARSTARADLPTPYRKKVVHVTTPEGKQGIQRSGFDLGRSGSGLSGDSYGPGVYMADNDILAAFWANQLRTKNESGEVPTASIRGDVDLKNPLVVEDMRAAGRRAYGEPVYVSLDRRSIVADRLPGHLERFDALVAEGISPNAALGQVAREAGHDGLVLQRQDGDEIIAFDPASVVFEQPSTAIPEASVEKTEPDVRATMREVKSITDKGKMYRLPGTPVPEGHVRLFRGEGARTADAADPRSADDPERASAQGRWFTTNPHQAAGYADMGGPGGRIAWVDVPADVAKAAEVASNPDLDKRLAGGLAKAGEEYLLPPEWAERAASAPDDKPAVTFDKARIIPTRAGVVAQPIDEQGQPSGPASTPETRAQRPVPGRPASPPTPAPLRPEGTPRDEAPFVVPGDRWYGDRGATPGEPAYFLDVVGDDLDSAKAAITEHVGEGTDTVTYEVVDRDGNPLGTWGTLEEAARGAEERFPAAAQGSTIAGEGGPSRGAPGRSRSAEPRGADRAPLGDASPADEPRAEGGGEVRAGGAGGGAADQRGDVRSDDVARPEPGPGAGVDAGGVGVSPERGRRAAPGRRPKRAAGDRGEAARGGEERAGDEQQPERDERDSRDDEPRHAARDFRITDADAIGAGGPKEKARANLAAIRLLKQIEEAGRPATPDEQKILVKYAGWGGIPQIFDPNNKEWAKDAAALSSLLTAEEYAAARASTPNAHYTSAPVIAAMWRALERLGLGAGARILEPSMGAGHFFGLMPEALRGGARTGVELDSITGRIAALLYPEADVHVRG
ncbi:MAG TPA: hypothetical protein VEA38_21250, partial [Terriglobales bacterium]|nr:hypothetical protein [Terriglobales bacterium]